jgi:hypothetical protein
VIGKVPVGVDPAVAMEHLDRAMRHDPLHGQHHMTMRTAFAHALFFLDKYDEAMAWAEGNIRESLNNLTIVAHLDH